MDKDPFLTWLLFPPPIHRGDPVHPPPASIFLEPYGYFSARRNHTTAQGFTRAGHRILVTFWASCPPRPSCFTFHCPDLDPSALFGDIPIIVTSEEDLALLRFAICRRGDHVYPESIEHFVYQAGTTRTGPLLHRLPTAPDPEFAGSDAALLRCRDRFFVAVLRPRYSIRDRFRYDLQLYNSKTGTWISKLMYSPEDFQYTSKVITIGGKLGSVGWVDLWRGILIYDVFLDHRRLRYISLPSPVVPKPVDGLPDCIRDVVVAQGCIKYFDMTTYIKPSSTSPYNYIPHGWQAETWKMDLSKTDLKWDRDCRINISEVPVNNTPYAQMLPIPQKSEDKESILMSLHVGHPALSLQDDAVYIMNRCGLHENNGWVIAVDMRNQTLKDVASFGSGRPLCYGFTYIVSGISRHMK